MELQRTYTDDIATIILVPLNVVSSFFAVERVETWTKTTEQEGKIKAFAKMSRNMKIGKVSRRSLKFSFFLRHAIFLSLINTFHGGMVSNIHTTLGARRCLTSLYSSSFCKLLILLPQSSVGGSKRTSWQIELIFCVREEKIVWKNYLKFVFRNEMNEWKTCRISVKFETSWDDSPTVVKTIWNEINVWVELRAEWRVGVRRKERNENKEDQHEGMERMNWNWTEKTFFSQSPKKNTHSGETMRKKNKTNLKTLIEKSS